MVLKNLCYIYCIKKNLCHYIIFIIFILLKCFNYNITNLFLRCKHYCIFR